MAHKKLQKLCYYAVAWHYALYNSKLFDDDSFEAWVHGPVSNTLWVEYKDYGWQPIHNSVSKPVFDDEKDEFLESVYNTYGEFSGHQLEALTHEDDPWKEARKGLDECAPSKNIIDPEIMKRYYCYIYQKSQND